MNDDALEEIIKAAIEKTTAMLAKTARHMSRDAEGLTGQQALNAFADSIDATNNSGWENEGGLQ